MLRTGGAGTVATITGAGTGLNVVIPAATVAQDLLFLHFAQAFDGVPACPAGWNIAILSGAATSGVAIATLGEITCWRKVIAGDPGTTVVLTRSSGVAAAALIMSYRGVDTSLVGTTPGTLSPLRQAAAAAYNPGTAGFSTTFPALSAVTAIANEEIVAFGASASASTWTSPAGAYVIQRSGNVAGITVGTGDKNIAAAGTTVALQAVTLSASGVRQGMTFALTNDTGAPTNGLDTMSLLSGNAYQAAAGGSIYYNGNNAGSLTLSDPFTDAQSGPFSVNYPVMAGVWTHTNETPTTLPNFTSGTFNWSASAAAAPALSLTQTDAGGNTLANAVTLVNDTAAPPAFGLTAPAGGATIANGQAVSAAPTDAGSGVAQVEFRYCAGFSCTFASGTSIGIDTVSAYSVAWNGQPLNGTYTIVARATDNVGNTTDSSTVTVTVSNAGATTPSVDMATAVTFATATGTTLTWSQTVGAQSNRILLVSASEEHSLACSTTGVTYGGVPMILIGDITTTGVVGPNRDCVSLWYMLNPPTGTANVVATMTPSTTTALSGGGVVIYNAKQAAPDASVTNLNESGIASATLTTTTANSLVVDTYSSGNGIGNLAQVAPQALIWTVDGNATESTGMSYKTIAAPSATTMSWTHSTPAVENRSVIVAAAFSTDTTPPTSALSFTEATNPGGQFELSTGAHAWTYYYNPAATGTFTMTDAATDASGIDSVDFPDIAVTGFTGTALQDTAAAYTSNTYTFTNANIAAPAAETVYVYDTFGNSTTEAVTFVKDSILPTGGAVSVPAFSGTLGGITITKTNFSDADSGIATNVITRSNAQAPTGPGVCPAVGTFSGATVVTSPDTVPTDGQCYLYTLTGTDNVGNIATLTTATILVDTTVPSTPTVTFSGVSANAWDNGSGTIFFRPSAGGAFTVNAASTDAQSNILAGNPGYTFLTPNSNGGTNFGIAQTAGAYALTFGATATGPTTSRTVTSTNNAGLTSTAGTYNITQDSANPTGGAVSVPAFSGTLGGITITKTNFSDAGSGIATNVITRSNAQAPTGPGVCPAVGTFSGATVVTSPDTVPTDGQCYLYTLTGTDRVGNAATAASATILVDTTVPSTPTVTFSGVSANAWDNGSGTIFFRPSAGGAFTVNAASTDAQSNILAGNPGYTFLTPNSNGGTNFGIAQTAGAYALTFGATATGPTTSRTVTSTNNAGLTSTAGTYNITQDSANPTAGAFTANGIAASGAAPAATSPPSGPTLLLSGRTDYSDAGSGLASSILTIKSATLTGASAASTARPPRSSARRHRPS